MINSFTGKYFFLSNFYEAPVCIFGQSYLNSEAAFQAQKTVDPQLRSRFADLEPGNAKRLGQKIEVRKDWEYVKGPLMYLVCRCKFTQNPELRAKLLATGDEHLMEGNTWGDTEWGTVNGVGKNKLGYILMKIRDELRLELA